MSFQHLIICLQKLTTVHEQLYSLSLEKTECIKESAMEELSKLLMHERKHLQSIEQLENQRQQEVATIYRQRNIESDEQTVSDIIEQSEDNDEKAVLEEVVTNLIQVIVKLKENESLNKQLVEQSLQFVHLSLDMLQPSFQGMNYGEENKKQKQSGRSVFDSKA